MLELLTNRHRLCDGIDRRHFMRAGFLGIGGLTLADYLRLQTQAAPESEYRRSPSPKSVILLWQTAAQAILKRTI